MNRPGVCCLHADARPGQGTATPIVTGRHELRELTAAGAQFVEVLPAADYKWAHLPGAVSIPLKELDARTRELDQSRPVIVYCHDCY